MAGHPLNYEPYPGVNPAGGPEAREQIHTDPDMFGAAIGRGLSQLGQGIEHADNEGFDIATMMAKQDDQNHANELHSWQSDQVTNAQEKFLTLRGKDAEMALPTSSKQSPTCIGRRASKPATPTPLSWSTPKAAGSPMWPTVRRRGTPHSKGPFGTPQRPSMPRVQRVAGR